MAIDIKIATLGASINMLPHVTRFTALALNQLALEGTKIGVVIREGNSAEERSQLAELKLEEVYSFESEARIAVNFRITEVGEGDGNLSENVTAVALGNIYKMFQLIASSTIFQSVGFKLLGSSEDVFKGVMSASSFAYVPQGGFPRLSSDVLFGYAGPVLNEMTEKRLCVRQGEQTFLVLSWSQGPVSTINLILRRIRDSHSSANSLNPVQQVSSLLMSGLQRLELTLLDRDQIEKASMFTNFNAVFSIGYEPTNALI